MEIPTIYKALISGNIPTIHMVKNMVRLRTTYLHLLDPEDLPVTDPSDHQSSRANPRHLVLSVLQEKGVAHHWPHLVRVPNLGCILQPEPFPHRKKIKMDGLHSPCLASHVSGYPFYQPFLYIEFIESPCLPENSRVFSMFGTTVSHGPSRTRHLRAKPARQTSGVGRRLPWRRAAPTWRDPKGSWLPSG